MSNVLPHEIVALVCRAWGVTVADMAERQQACQPFHIGGYAARACAMLLMRRHTQASGRAISEAVGMCRLKTNMIDHYAGTFERYAARHPEIARRVEAIEHQIDAIHERRMSTIEPLMTAQRERRPTNIMGFQ